ncbi:MAG TPA: glycosyltransferase [Steroidobacteraceae bacterium]|jgi:glycosyltransferase involved in cell wall biosynthesis
MKILMVSPTATHPVTAGNRARILALAKALQGLGHEVHFALATVALETADLDAMRCQFGAHLHVLKCRLPYAVTGVLPRLMRRMLRTVGDERAWLWGLDDYYDVQLTPQLAALCERVAYDAVCVEYVFMSKAFEAVPPGVLKILDTHDRFALRHRTFLHAGQIPQWFSTSVAEETAGLCRADYVMAIQDREAEAFSTQLGAARTRVVTVGHLLDLEVRVAPAAAPSAVFLASDNPINVDAAEYFIERVLPLVLREQPDFSFILAGNVGAKVVGTNPAVRRLGRVASVADAFGAARIAVNPVRLGTGLNIKMLEALACGVACVSSETGGRGFEQYRDQAFATVRDEDPAAMAQTILQLLRDPARVAALGDAGLKLAREWNAQQLTGLVQVLAGAPDSARAVADSQAVA